MRSSLLRLVPVVLLAVAASACQPWAQCGPKCLPEDPPQCVSYMGGPLDCP